MEDADDTHISQSSFCNGSARRGLVRHAGSRTRSVKGNHPTANPGAATAGHGAAAANHDGHALCRTAEPGATDIGPGRADERDCERAAAEDERGERSDQRKARHQLRPGAVAERLGRRTEDARRQAGEDDSGYAEPVAEIQNPPQGATPAELWRRHPEKALLAPVQPAQRSAM